MVQTKVPVEGGFIVRNDYDTGWGRVGGLFTSLFNTNPVYLGAGSVDVGKIEKPIFGASVIGSGLYGGALISGATPGGAITTSAVPTSVGSGIGIGKSALIGAGAGLGILGLSSLFGGGNPPQTSTQTTNETTNTITTTNNQQYDYSKKLLNQNTYNNMANSPYGYIGVSPTQTLTSPQTQTPSVSVPTSQSSGQQASQSASSGISTTMILVAGAVILAFLYVGNKGGKKK